MAYNLSTTMNDFSLTGGIIEINRQANNALVIVLFIGIFAITWWGLKNYESGRAFTSASFLCLILSIIAYEIGLCPIYMSITFLLMSIGGLIMMRNENG